MQDEKRKILEMVGEGKISQEDALRLLEALEEDPVDRAFGEAMSQLREEGPPQPEAPQPAGPEAPPPRLEGDIWGEVEEAAREVGQVLSQTASVTMDALSEGVQWAKGAVQKIPGVNVWWGSQQDEGEASQPYNYQDGAPKVEKVEIEWVNGPVEVVPWEGDWINVTEYSRQPLEQGQQLGMAVTEGGTLHIRWTRDRKFLSGLRLSKYLLVQVPAGLGLEKLKIDNISGSVRVAELSCEDAALGTTSGQAAAQDIRCGKLKISSVSGRVYAENVQAGALEMSSTSGRVEAAGFGCQRAKLQTVSGKVQAYGNGEMLSVKSVSGRVNLETQLPPGEVRLETISGRVQLALPENCGFTAVYESMSGTFSSQFPINGELGGKSGKAVYGDGGTQVYLHTMSGKMEICKGGQG